MKRINISRKIVNICNTLEEALVYVQQKVCEDNIDNLDYILKDIVLAIECISNIVVINNITQLIVLTDTLKAEVIYFSNNIHNKNIDESRDFFENIINKYNNWRENIENYFSPINVYNNNINNIVNRYGENIQNVIDNNISSTELEILSADDRCFIVYEKGESRSRVYDRYMLNEIEDQDILHSIKEESIIIVYGFGMGYYVNEIFNKMSQKNYLLIIEPDIGLFKEVMKYNKFSELFSSENVYLSLGSDIKQLKRVLSVVLNYINRINKKVYVTANGRYDYEYNEFYNKCILEINKLKEDVHLNFYPLKTKQSTYIGQPLFKNENEEGYYTAYYNEIYKEFSPNLCDFHKNDILFGKEYSDSSIHIIGKKDSVLPILPLQECTDIVLKIDNKEYKYKNLPYSKYNYFPIKEDCKISIKSNKKIVIGKQFDLKQKNKHKVKLVLNIFIDGLAKYALNKDVIKSYMKNTSEFFGCGINFDNCYANAEWTLPSVPSIFTGTYSNKHKMYHPNALPYKLNDNNTSLQEYFQKEDYYTFQICGDWRKSPVYGYTQGFDRTVYKRAMNYKDVIFTFLEQMRAFKDRDQFGWISFFDLHDLVCPIPDISNQIQNSLNAHDYYDNDKEKSVYKQYSERKSEMYVNQIKHLDYYLKIIYDYIEANYSNDEIIVTLCSDHGQAYLGEDNHELSDCRTQIPLLIRGRGIDKFETNEFIENVDILPMILNSCGIEFNENSIDGIIPEATGGNKKREYVYSQSIFPGKTFKAVIRDRKYKFLFETKEKVLDDGRVKIEGYTTKLIDILSGKEESYNEKINKYSEVVLERINNISIK